MGNLISRQEALKAVSWDTEAYMAISMLPSAQPERKKGKWIVVTRHEHYPSGKSYEQLQCPFCNRIDHNGDGNFCGYCGADMRGEQDE